MTDLGDQLSSLKKDLKPENIKEVVKEEVDGIIDDVKEEIIEAKESFVEQIKETGWGLLNSIFGDFKLFWSVFKTIIKWFFNPLSFNIREVEKENALRASKGLKPLYFMDFALMKSLFMLSLTFLVIEEAAIDASQEQWIQQGVFLLFFVVLLFIFIGAMWIWKMVLKIKLTDARSFIGMIIYQYASIYIISFIVAGPLGIDVLSEEADGSLFFAIYAIPLLQSIYFLFKLMRYYQVTGPRRFFGFLIGTIFLLFFLLIPPVVNNLFLQEGLA